MWRFFVLSCSQLLSSLRSLQSPFLQIVELFGVTSHSDIVESVSRMGQRGLQDKFRRVFHMNTNSTNNHWLRRKLLECCGVPSNIFTSKGCPVSPRSSSGYQSPSFRGLNANEYTTPVGTPTVRPMIPIPHTLTPSHLFFPQSVQIECS